MQPSLDRFSWAMFHEFEPVQPADVVGLACDVCGALAHYRLQGLKGDYCRTCMREAAADLGMDPEEEVELIL